MCVCSCVEVQPSYVERTKLRMWKYFSVWLFIWLCAVCAARRCVFPAKKKKEITINAWISGEFMQTYSTDRSRTTSLIVRLFFCSFHRIFGAFIIILCAFCCALFRILLNSFILFCFFIGSHNYLIWWKKNGLFVVAEKNHKNSVFISFSAHVFTFVFKFPANRPLISYTKFKRLSIILWSITPLKCVWQTLVYYMNALKIIRSQHYRNVESFHTFDFECDDGFLFSV